MQLRLPLGGTIKPMPDITKGLPSTCSLNFNLALQIAPIMASIECLMNVLEVHRRDHRRDQGVQGQPAVDPVEHRQADHGRGRRRRLHRKGHLPPLGILPFIKDLLLMIARILRCIVEALQKHRRDHGRAGAAARDRASERQRRAAGPAQCAKENAELAAAGQMQAIEPIQVLLDLAKPFFALGDIPEIALPAIGSDTDIDALKQVLETLDTVLGAIETAAEAIPA